MTKRFRKYLIVFVIGIIAFELVLFTVLNKQRPENGKPSYSLILVSNTSTIKPNSPTHLAFQIRDQNDNPVKDFSIVHEKLLHFILVRKDLQAFQHLHPDFNPQTGTFTVDMQFPTNGRYRIFADFSPGKGAVSHMPAVTLQKDIVVQHNQFAQAKVTQDTSSTKRLPNGYEITYTIPKHATAKTPFQFSIAVKKDGKPVTDIENYLGARGHSVILKEKTLSYIHTHAGEVINFMDHTQHAEHDMDHGDTNADSNTIDFSADIPEPGVYKLFTQFQHEGKVITTDYVVKINVSS